MRPGGSDVETGAVTNEIRKPPYTFQASELITSIMRILIAPSLPGELDNRKSLRRISKAFTLNHICHFQGCFGILDPSTGDISPYFVPEF